MIHSVELPFKKMPVVILAGGKSSRMGGHNKALIKLGKKRLLEYVLLKLKKATPNIALNVNSDYDAFKKYNLPLISDTLTGYLGPLAGVLTAMKWAEDMGSPVVLTVAADTPFFPKILPQKFEEFIFDYDLVMASTQDQDGKIERHPTFCMWSVRLKSNLELSLKNGLRKIISWTDQFSVKNVEFVKSRGVDPFFNINTKEDLHLAEKLLREGAF